MNPIPLRDKVVVRLLPQAQRSSLLVTPETQTPIRQATCLAVGPDASEITVGGTYLVNILTGQSFADDTLVLPKASLVAELT